MPYSQSQHQEFIEFAKQLADESAEIIRHFFRAGYDVEFKTDATPVTIADRRAEEAMRTLILQRYPNHGVLGEEFGHSNPDAEYQWVLDPIDGTKNFVAGTYLFGTLIALLKNGRPIVGVINQPIVNDFLVGDGTQTWLNEVPVSVKPVDSIDQALMVSTYHHTVWSFRNGAAYEDLTKKVMRYRTWGDCHGYYLVATGGAQIMADPIMEKWDLMALIPIIEGAGGTITDWYGKDVLESGGKNGAVATAGGFHEEVIGILNPS